MRRVIPLSILAVLVILTVASIAVSLGQWNPDRVSMFESCSSTIGQQPSTYAIYCADANGEFTNLTWQDWGDATAYGSGTARRNDCMPTCVAGKWKSEPVTVWAWRIRNHLYTRLSSSDPKLVSTIALKSYPG